ncbi:FMN-dependent NADH-azoreductase [Bradyrhizobium liaoningense]
MKLLHIDSSVLGPHSVSRQVSAAIVDRLRQTTPGLDVTYRDLTQTPLAHLSGSHLAAAQGAPAPAELAPDLAASAAVLEEFLSADVVVIGAPMYNFTIPSQLKAWIDRILVVGKTFKYSAAGPEGLAGSKRVIVAISRGGYYGGGLARRGAGAPRKLSARRVRLHRHPQCRIHHRRRHPGRTGSPRESARGRASSGHQPAGGLTPRRDRPPPKCAAADGCTICKAGTRRSKCRGSRQRARRTGRSRKTTRWRRTRTCRSAWPEGRIFR